MLSAASVISRKDFSTVEDHCAEARYSCEVSARRFLLDVKTSRFLTSIRDRERMAHASSSRQLLPVTSEATNWLSAGSVIWRNSLIWEMMKVLCPRSREIC